MPSEAATSYFHQGSAITYPNSVVTDFRIPCKGNIEGASAYVSICRAQSWHQIYLLKNLWPTNDVDANLHIQKATKSFAYDEDTKARKIILDRLAISKAIFCGENHLHYFTKANSSNCVVYGVVA